jgi:hypothetical protein
MTISVQQQLRPVTVRVRRAEPSHIHQKITYATQSLTITPDSSVKIMSRGLGVTPVRQLSATDCNTKPPYSRIFLGTIPDPEFEARI